MTTYSYIKVNLDNQHVAFLAVVDELAHGLVAPVVERAVFRLAKELDKPSAWLVDRLNTEVMLAGDKNFPYWQALAWFAQHD